MKTNNLHGKPALVAKTRWLAYATAGAATALTSGHSAEAAIHYSGLQNAQFGPHQSKIRKAPLDQAGDYLVFAHGTDGLNHYSNFAGFSVVGIASAAFAGSDRFSNYEYDVFRLPIGTNILANKFIHPYWSNYSRWGEVAGILASDFASDARWGEPGIGFVGFRFDNGAGVQYGWVRVRMSKLTQNAFTVLDYAYADPGESITAGQRSSDQQIPDQGSLGWLAAGAVGLLAWRKSRSLTAR